jgi:ribosomal protein L12E/L44/L45/RPP1/RPP2
MMMKNRTAALLLSLLICASAAAAPMSAWADEEEQTTAAEEAVQEDETEAEEKTSGDFTYTVTDEGTACITRYNANEKDVVIPGTIDGLTVTELGPWVFGEEDGSACVKATIPASVEYISSNNPFKVCMMLEEVIVEDGNENYVTKDGVLYTKDMTKLFVYPAKKAGTSFEIPEGVKTLGSAAIYATSLETIKFPSTLEETSDFSLGENVSIKSVDISGTSIEELGSYCFAGCTGLEEIKFPESLRTIGGAAFYGCKALTSVELPGLLTAIRQYAFIDTGLTSVTIPSTVQDIGYCAFGYSTTADGGETADPNFVIIGEYGSAAQTYAVDADSDYGYSNNFIFRSPDEDSDLEEILSFDRQTWGEYEFAVENGEVYILLCNSTDAVVKVPEEIYGIPVTTIYSVAFSNTPAEEVIIPEGVKEIKKLAFNGCYYLKKLTLPQSLETIGDSAFADCDVLETLDLGGAVTIGADAFYGCTSLKELTISGNCQTIGVDDEEPFITCSQLEKITVTSGDGKFSSQDGVLYSSDKKALLYYPQGKTDKTFTAPKGLKIIQQSAIFANKYLEEADLSGVEEIGAGAFEGCTALKKVKLSKDLTTLGEYAFLDCTELKSLRFYDKLETIGDYACGYYYEDQANLLEDEENGEALIEGFKIYADKGTKGYDYAKKNNIEVVTDTVEVFGKNIDKRLLYIFGGGLGAVLAAVIGVFASKKAKKKKAEKEKADRKQKAAEARKKKAEEEEKSSDGKEKENDEQA